MWAGTIKGLITYIHTCSQGKVVYIIHISAHVGCCKMRKAENVLPY